jgi:phage replication O-like protein O
MNATEPHPRNGHLRIPNRVVEDFSQLSTSGTQSQVIWAVLRKTIGWQKSGEWQNNAYPISLSDICQSTGISRRQAMRDITDLADRHVIDRQLQNGRPSLIRLNMYSSSWVMAKSSQVTEMSIGNDECVTGTSDETVTEPVTELSPAPDRKYYLGNKPQETIKKLPKETREIRPKKLKSARSDESKTYHKGVRPRPLQERRRSLTSISGR